MDTGATDEKGGSKRRGKNGARLDPPSLGTRSGQAAPEEELPTEGGRKVCAGGGFVVIWFLVFAPSAFSPPLGLGAGHGLSADRPCNWELGDPRELKADGYVAGRKRGVQNSSLRALPGCG